MEGIAFLLGVGVLFAVNYCAAQGGDGKYCVVEDMLQRCFTIYSTQVAWQAAADQCTQTGGRLAVLDNDKVNQMVNSHISDAGFDRKDDFFYVWIGSRQDPTIPWSWVTGQNFTAQGTLTMNASSDSRSFQTCSALLSGEPGLQLHGRRCRNQERMFICQQKASNDNDSENKCSINKKTGMKAGEMCYVVFGDLPGDEETYSWWEARSYCQGVEAELATFTPETLDYADQLSNYFQLSGNDSFFWIGLRKSPFVWMTNVNAGATATDSPTDMVYTNWIAGEPSISSFKCVATGQDQNDNVGWTPQDCVRASWPYACEFQTRLTTTTITTLSTTVAEVYDSSTNATATSSELTAHLINILVPSLLFGLAILGILIGMCCYCSKRREGYTQHP